MGFGNILPTGNELRRKYAGNIKSTVGREFKSRAARISQSRNARTRHKRS